jgi:hypothetical protein
VLTGEKSLMENIDVDGRMILKRAIKTWTVCEQNTE